MTTVFESDDVEAAHHMLAEAYGVRKFTANRSHVRVSQDTLGPIGLHQIKFGGVHCLIDGEPLGAYYFAHVRDGRISFRHAGESPVYGPGSVFMAADPQLSYTAEMSDADYGFTILRTEALDRVADSNQKRSNQPVRITAYQPATARHAKLWVDTYTYVRDTVAATDLSDQPLLVSALEQLLAAAALSAFPNTAVLEPTAADRRDAHTTTLQRAIAFIDDNAHRDLSAADIAAASFVTVRALQHAFRRHLQTTPMAYLRDVRLAHVHRELTAADPAGTAVGDVAARWGMHHHSRFTARYKTVYGVTPSETLRRE